MGLGLGLEFPEKVGWSGFGRERIQAPAFGGRVFGDLAGGGEVVEEVVEDGFGHAGFVGEVVTELGSGEGMVGEGGKELVRGVGRWPAHGMGFAGFVGPEVVFPLLDVEVGVGVEDEGDGIAGGGDFTELFAVVIF